MSFGCGLDSALGVNWQATRKRNHLNLKEKFTRFCKAKDTVSRTKRPPTDWEKIFNNPTSNRGLISNIYKELKKLDYRHLAFWQRSTVLKCVDFFSGSSILFH